MDSKNIENLNEDQILELYNDIVENEGNYIIGYPYYCYSGQWCCGGRVCYIACDYSTGSERINYTLSTPCK